MCSLSHHLFGGKVGRGLPSPCRETTWCHHAGKMLGCPCSPLGRGAPGQGDTHVLLWAFCGQGFLKLKCINHRHGNPGMKFKRPLAALDVWSHSKAAVVEPSLEQNERFNESRVAPTQIFSSSAGTSESMLCLSAGAEPHVPGSGIALLPSDLQ